ncbi:MAG: hypothetical protein L0332_32825 [Chloroflexi bacterium]|nr:hypothetical protein [Chloroflexota bacterium]MCI0647472.1 hypothetical protein [Chloroflexota bacterium]MCI0731488.1 hypothetical protein [Chloroflexota bacterium]
MIESDVYPSLPTEKESASQTALARWFAEQHIKSVDNLEKAARQIITLCTALLGTLLGLMALTEETLPRHMQWSGIQWISGVGVVGLFAALACALYVVMPRPNPVSLNDPGSLQTAFAMLLARKQLGLRLAIIIFAIALLCFMLVVVVSLAFVV